MKSNNKQTQQFLILTLPVLALLAVAGLIYWYLIVRPCGSCKGLLLTELNPMDALWCCAALAASLAVLAIFLRIFPMRLMYDPNVRIMADSFSLAFLAVYFIPNAFYEELIFRGALQPIIGLPAAALLFTLVHFSYYKRPLLLVEVFIQGLILGGLFTITGSLWVTTIAHTALNTIETALIQTGRIEYHE